jgi:hypothetical protein
LRTFAGVVTAAGAVMVTVSVVLLAGVPVAVGVVGAVLLFVGMFLLDVEDRESEGPGEAS